MLAYQARVVDEKAGLDKNIAALAAFMAKPGFYEVDPAERQRLMKQHELMTDYSLVLGERIAAFAFPA